MWRACKSPSRVQWYPKLHPLVFSVCFLPFEVRVMPLSCSVVPKTTPSRVQCDFSFFFAAGRIHDLQVSEKQKNPPLTLTNKFFSPQAFIFDLCIGGNIRNSRPCTTEKLSARLANSASRFCNTATQNRTYSETHRTVEHPLDKNLH